MCLEFQQRQPKEKKLAHEMPGKLCETLGTGIFTLNKIINLCNADYISKFLMVKRIDGLSVDDLIRSCKIISPEYGLPKRNNV